MRGAFDCPVLCDQCCARVVLRSAVLSARGSLSLSSRLNLLAKRKSCLTHFLILWIYSLHQMIDRWLAVLAAVNLFMPVQICVFSSQLHAISHAVQNANPTALILRQSMASSANEEGLNHTSFLQGNHVQFAGKLAKGQQEQLNISML